MIQLFCRAPAGAVRVADCAFSLLLKAIAGSTRLKTHTMPKPVSLTMLLCCVLFPAGFLDWGWQAGCDFVGKTCTAYAAAHPGQQFFCTKEQYSRDNVNTVCTFDGLARAQCAEAPFAEGCAMKVSERASIGSLACYNNKCAGSWMLITVHGLARAQCAGCLCRGLHIEGGQWLQIAVQGPPVLVVLSACSSR